MIRSKEIKVQGEEIVMGKAPIVRLKSIEIENLAGVVKGQLQLDKSKLGKDLDEIADGRLSIDEVDSTKPEEVSVLGLYGQNGSGKSTLVNALSLLRNAVARKKIKYRKFSGYETGCTVLKCNFLIWEEERKEEYNVTYEIKLVHDLRKVQFGNQDDQASQILMIESGIMPKEINRFFVKSEVLSYSYFSPEEQIRKTVAISTSVKDEPFGPGTRLKSMVKDKQAIGELIEHKKTCYGKLKSFIFSKKMAKVAENSNDPRIGYILRTLHEFAVNRWIIISSAQLNEAKSLRMQFPYPLIDPSGSFTIEIPILGPVLLTAPEFARVQEVITPLGALLPMLIPGHSIELAIKPSGLTPPFECALVSVLDNGRRIPFRNESDGVKRTVSILLALISMYHQKSVTVVIDEMDASIFEYLLGQILDVLAIDGRGQLIFTSHNLHLLEVLDKQFLAFTTPNPENRYTTKPLRNIKKSNNLRDVYYRRLQLGLDDEPLYERVSTEDISDAFREIASLEGPNLLDIIPKLKELIQKKDPDPEVYKEINEILKEDPRKVTLLAFMLMGKSDRNLHEIVPQLRKADDAALQAVGAGGAMYTLLSVLKDLTNLLPSHLSPKVPDETLYSHSSETDREEESSDE